MKPSLFAPNGLLLLKGGTPAAQAIHATIVQLFTDGSDGKLASEVGTFVDCFAFALARIVARVQRRQEQLEGERLAMGAYELLAQLEEESGLYPAVGDTIAERRAALLARGMAAQGSRRPVFEQALRDLLGDDYIGFHVADPASEVSIWPSNLGDSPQLLALPDQPNVLVSLPYAISTGLGSPQYVTYVPIEPVATDSASHTLLVGDKVVVQPENLGLAETVTVTGTMLAGENDGPLLFQATFNHAHEPGSLAVCMPFPAWGSSQRHLWIVLTETAALDAETRRKVHELCARMVTGVTTWSICPQNPDSFGSAGPWTLDDAVLGALDYNPMALITVP